MNLDEFEKKLQDQPMREIPGEWRHEILRAATLKEIVAPWWQQLLWPCPQAWAGLAAVWLVILGLNARARDKSNAQDSPKVAISREELKELKEQQVMLARLMAPEETAESPPTTTPAVLSPRSERRKTIFYT